MKTVEACMRDAWKALLADDLDERDRQVAFARNILNAQDRCRRAAPGAMMDAVVGGEPILLPDLSAVPVGLEHS